jgi:hypothetical protein
MSGKSWRSSEYVAFWNKITTEVWMIERFVEDWGLWDLGIKPSYFPKIMSQKALRHLAKETSKATSYLIPWIFVMTYKIMEVIHETTRERVPVTFSKHPVLLQVCENLRERFRKARNKIVHVGKYGVYAFPYREGKKTFYDDCLMVRDEKSRRVIRISIYDVLCVGFFISYLTRAIRDKRIRGSYLEAAYDHIEPLESWIPDELFLEAEKVFGKSDSSG